MRIAYRGNFGVRHSTESHIAATLESMGHDVERCQENKVSWADQAGICRQEASNADLFLWTCTHGYANKWRAGEALEAIKSIEQGTVTAAIHLDRFFGLKRETQVTTEPWFKLQHVFTADGDNEQAFKDAGVNHHFLMPGVFDQECYLGTHRDEYASDIAFVGCHTPGYHPEYSGRMQLVNWLKQTYGDRCRFWPEPGKHAVRNEDLNDLYASVKVVVGDSCFADTSVNYTSDRPYETVGRGGFLLYPFIPCVAKELTGDHITMFAPGHFKELEVLIDHFLESEQDERRLAIRKAGSAYVKENCSYRNRLSAMLTVMGLG